MENKYITITTILFSLSVVIIIFLIVVLNINYIYNFEDACESFGGNFYQLQNTSCNVGHEDCIYICNLNGEYYDLDSVGKQFDYNKYFCIEDCNYENKLNKGTCVC